MYLFPELWKHLLKTVKSSSKNGINHPFPCPLAYLRRKGQFGVLCPTQLRSYGAELLPKTGVFLLAVVFIQYFCLLWNIEKEIYTTWMSLKKQKVMEVVQKNHVDNSWDKNVRNYSYSTYSTWL